MTTSVRVQCINKTDRLSRHDRIKNIGGVNPDGSRWHLSEKAAIGYIENGTYTFYTQGGGVTANVVIASHNGLKYLKTDRDSTTQDNLLSLPECPA